MEEVWDKISVLFERVETEHAAKNYQVALEKLDHVQLLYKRHGLAGDTRYHLSRGVVLEALGRVEEAAAEYKTATELSPDEDQPFVGLGNVYLKAGRALDAVQSYRRAASVFPAEAANWGNLAVGLKAMGRYAEALPALHEALARIDAQILAEPGDAATLIQRKRNFYASLLDLQLKVNPVAALSTHEEYQQLLASDGGRGSPSAAEATAMEAAQLPIDLVHLRTGGLLGGEFYARLARYRESERSRLIEPYHCPEIVPLSPADCFGVTQNWVSSRVSHYVTSHHSALNLAPLPTGPPAKAHERGLPLKVALYSGRGFAEYLTTTWMLAPLWGELDRDAVTAVGFADHHSLSDALNAKPGAGTLSQDEGGPARKMTSAALGGPKGFVEVPGNTTETALALGLRRWGAEVLVDLAGHTGGRFPYLALQRRMAPVQMHFHGYPGSLGISGIDYIIADRYVAPAELAAALFTEKVVYLPDSYLFAGHRGMAPHWEDRPGTHAPLAGWRRQVGLPAEGEGTVFCSFNQLHKVTPKLLALWMNVLKNVPDSHLWQLAHLPGAASLIEANLRAEAARHGINPSRIVVTSLLHRGVERARKGVCDLVLDTPHINGHVTTADALWAGVPVLTHMGTAAWTSRVAASLLATHLDGTHHPMVEAHTRGSHQLIAADLAEYERTAISLGNDPAALQALKAKLRDLRATSPVFDAKRFAGNFQRALLAASEIYNAGKNPMHIII